ncbi:hypothetical protein Q9290_03015 [Oceanimonas sp. CHS3-5]|uniref:hypothetical protein n=1 Tax=Oceanimonas sp. CHS3-5 TaxID=3068186 RepID=UPI00273F58B9|nr:hypothetical protein [Oceanimonas sp. CHS3-5]MDP5291264.1 hypothetical protein [Oceanimonas sp. CHS3-5]
MFSAKEYAFWLLATGMFFVTLTWKIWFFTFKNNNNEAKDNTMNMDRFTVAVIGGGHAGLALLNKLVEADFVNILGVADMNPEAPGMLLAKEHGVATTTDMQDLLKDSQQLDILIDVTGVKAVRDSLRQHMQDTGNYHTIIMHERISALVLSLFNGEMVATKASDNFY